MIICPQGAEVFVSVLQVSMLKWLWEKFNV